MSGFNSSMTGDFDKYFMTTTDLIDRYAIGGLWTWGSNNNGQLGDNSTSRKSSPVQTVSAGTNWKQVSAGLEHTVSIKTDGTLWTFGYNFVGQLGDNTSTKRSSPVQTVSAGTNWKQVSARLYQTASIKTDGTLWLWGSNFHGGLGDNTRTDRLSPVQTISFGTNWKQVSAGVYYTAAIKTDGTLWLWGLNDNGQLGDNSVSNKSSPVQTISFGTNWKQVVCGSSHTAAIKTDGTLWLWGRDNYGQLGDNSVSNKSSPVQTISAGTNWKQVSSGAGHTAAIKTDGTLWLWGLNGFGQLGDNSISNKSSPVQTVSAGTNWKQVVCGDNHTAAVQYSDIGQVL
jgi:alpha-tubulin suppressor-like RCC1 family protein